MEKGKEPAPPPAPLPQRTDVKVGTNRCPFCHDAVEVEAPGWVACRTCQARHHDACWSESGACGACGEARYIADAAQERTAPAAAIDTNARQRRLATGMAIVMSLSLVPLVGLALTDPESRATWITTGALLFSSAIGLWSYARTGRDPQGYGQPLRRAKQAQDDPPS